MSRVGQKPVIVPQGVTVDIKGQAVSMKGKLGKPEPYAGPRRERDVQRRQSHRGAQE